MASKRAFFDHSPNLCNWIIVIRVAYAFTFIAISILLIAAPFETSWASQVQDSTPTATPGSRGTVQCTTGSPAAIIDSKERADVNRFSTEPNLADRIAPLPPITKLSEPELAVPFVSIEVPRDQGAKFYDVGNEISVKILGFVESNSTELKFDFVIETGCDGILRIDSGDRGLTLIVESDIGDFRFLGQIDTPWAISVDTSTRLPTWFTIAGNVVTQHIDARGTSGLIAFDPSYTALTCTYPRVDRSAADYLNMSMTDTPNFCPNLTMFYVSRHYLPVFAYESNLANDVGWVTVAGPSSGTDVCSNSPDTGPWFDFQVPCRAHDFCYDLIRAGFGASVSKSACDDRFFDLMIYHCNDQFPFFIQACFETAVAYYGAVVAFGSASPSPGYLTIRNINSLKCADIPGSSAANGAPLTQWSCGYTPNQYFQLMPTTVPGQFRIITQQSQNCLVSAWGQIMQWDCGSGQIFEFSPWSANNNDLWTMRSHTSTFGSCWDVAGSSVSNGAAVVDWNCANQWNQLWQLRL